MGDEERGKSRRLTEKREREKGPLWKEKKWVMVMPMIYFIRIHATGAFALVASQRGGRGGRGIIFSTFFFCSLAVVSPHFPRAVGERKPAFDCDNQERGWKERKVMLELGGKNRKRRSGSCNAVGNVG